MGIAHGGRELCFIHPDLAGRHFDGGNWERLCGDWSFPLWGGGKTWVGPQSGWPDGAPHRDLDSGAWTVERTWFDARDMGAELRSPVCSQSGLQITRRLNLSAGRRLLADRAPAAEPGPADPALRPVGRADAERPGGGPHRTAGRGRPRDRPAGPAAARAADRERGSGHRRPRGAAALRASAGIQMRLRQRGPAGWPWTSLPGRCATSAVRRCRPAAAMRTAGRWRSTRRPGCPISRSRPTRRWRISDRARRFAMSSPNRFGRQANKIPSNLPSRNCNESPIRGASSVFRLRLPAAESADPTRQGLRHA